MPARIVGVADVFDALISPRPYKAPWPVDKALAYIYAQRGRMFDPDCVDALIRNRGRLDDICARFGGGAGSVPDEPAQVQPQDVA